MSVNSRIGHVVWAVAAAVAVLSFSPRPAEARGVEDCMLWWAQAVRSYLMQNRTQGPDDEAFRPACVIESQGDKAKARIEAVMIGARALVKLDPRGCERFLEVYVEAKEPRRICDEAARAGTDPSLRKLIADSIPAKPTKQ